MQKVRKTSIELKRTVVRLTYTTGKPITQVIRELGMPDTSIQKFRKNRAEQARCPRRVARELEIVKQERERLKKAEASPSRIAAF
jgi:transposase-like protein